MSVSITVGMQAHGLIRSKRQKVFLKIPFTPLPDSPGSGVIGVAEAASTLARGGVRIRKELSLCLS